MHSRNHKKENVPLGETTILSGTFHRSTTENFLVQQVSIFYFKQTPSFRDFSRKPMSARLRIRNVNKALSKELMNFFSTQHYICILHCVVVCGRQNMRLCTIATFSKLFNAVYVVKFLNHHMNSHDILKAHIQVRLIQR